MDSNQVFKLEKSYCVIVNNNVYIANNDDSKLYLRNSIAAKEFKFCDEELYSNCILIKCNKANYIIGKLMHEPKNYEEASFYLCVEFPIKMNEYIENLLTEKLGKFPI